MLVDTVSIENKVLDALKNDATLSAYIKSFTKGDMTTARMLFPYVALGRLRKQRRHEKDRVTGDA